MNSHGSIKNLKIIGRTLTRTVKIFNVGPLEFQFGYFQKPVVPFQQIHTLKVFAQKVFGYPADAGAAVQNPSTGRAVFHFEQLFEKNVRIFDVRSGHTRESAEHTVYRGGNV